MVKTPHSFGHSECKRVKYSNQTAWNFKASFSGHTNSYILEYKNPEKTYHNFCHCLRYISCDIVE